MTDPAAPDLAIVELNALADRCEAAAGPDRELDAQIVEALGYTRTVEGSYYTGPILRYYGKGPLGQVDRLKKLTIPKFTASLDAAMSLRPERLDFGCGSRDETGTAWAWVGLFVGSDYIANAATPALALCAASLRALAKVRGR